MERRRYIVPEWYDHLLGPDLWRVEDRSTRYVLAAMCLGLARGETVGRILSDIDFPDERTARRLFRARVGLTPERFSRVWGHRGNSRPPADISSS